VVEYHAIISVTNTSIGFGHPRIFLDQTSYTQWAKPTKGKTVKKSESACILGAVLSILGVLAQRMPEILGYQ